MFVENSEKLNLYLSSCLCSSESDLFVEVFSNSDMYTEPQSLSSIRGPSLGGIDSCIFDYVYVTKNQQTKIIKFQAQPMFDTIKLHRRSPTPMFSIGMFPSLVFAEGPSTQSTEKRELQWLKVVGTDSTIKSGPCMVRAASMRLYRNSFSVYVIASSENVLFVYQDTLMRVPIAVSVANDNGNTVFVQTISKLSCNIFGKERQQLIWNFCMSLVETGAIESPNMVWFGQIEIGDREINRFSNYSANAELRVISSQRVDFGIDDAPVVVFPNMIDLDQALGFTELVESLDSRKSMNYYRSSIILRVENSLGDLVDVICYPKIVRDSMLFQLPSTRNIPMIYNAKISYNELVKMAAAETQSVYKALPTNHAVFAEKIATSRGVVFSRGNFSVVNTNLGNGVINNFTMNVEDPSLNMKVYYPCNDLDMDFDEDSDDAPEKFVQVNKTLFKGSSHVLLDTSRELVQVLMSAYSRTEICADIVASYYDQIYERSDNLTGGIIVTRLHSPDPDDLLELIHSLITDEGFRYQEYDSTPMIISQDLPHVVTGLNHGAIMSKLYLNIYTWLILNFHSFLDDISNESMIGINLYANIESFLMSVGTKLMSLENLANRASSSNSTNDDHIPDLQLLPEVYFRSPVFESFFSNNYNVDCVVNNLRRRSRNIDPNELRLLESYFFEIFENYTVST
jgi:hypothetical protein